jgi:hypothetical protein
MADDDLTKLRALAKLRVMGTFREGRRGVGQMSRARSTMRSFRSRRCATM